MTTPKLLLLAASLLCSLPALAQTRTNIVLLWEASPQVDQIQAILIYARTNLPPGMAITNSAPATNSFVPSSKEGWSVFRVLTNGAATDTLIRVADLPNAGKSPVFFAATYTNFMGESPFSNVAWIPRILPGDGQLWIR